MCAYTYINHTGLRLQWRCNKRDGISNHRRLDCLLNRLFRPKSKKTSKLRVTDLCEGNSPVTGEFPAQMACNAENVSISWRHHEMSLSNIQSFLLHVLWLHVAFTVIKTEMSFWRNFHHWPLVAQPVIKMSSKRHFHLSGCYIACYCFRATKTWRPCRRMC